jgi:HSP20 family protein
MASRAGLFAGPLGKPTHIIRRCAAMTLRHWDPFTELRHMEDAMDRVWRGFGIGRALNGPEAETWSVPLDVVREGDNVVVRASLPGVRPEDVEVSIEENVLTIKGKSKVEREYKEGDYLMRERRAGAFYRTLRLPDSLDTEKAEPHYEHGVLTIAFPRLESKKAKQLKITVGAGPKGMEGKKA